MRHKTLTGSATEETKEPRNAHAFRYQGGIRNAHAFRYEEIGRGGSREAFVQGVASLEPFKIRQNNGQ